ncbi:MAG: glycosyltransferase family 2 protein [Gammaproteobacteria bacterium]|nr:glycosyltransferase family 2 protein [Gammaproteobacteria bacterium]
MSTRGAHSIDVIVPAYNAGAAIAGTIDHLLGLLERTSADVRVIVCDDGSTDDTVRVLGGLVSDHLRLVALEQNRGRSGARNAAVAVSDACYLLFMDADCRPRDPDYFTRMLEQAAAGAILAYGPIEADSANDAFWRRYLEKVERQRDAAAVSGDHLRAIATGNLLLRRDLFDEAGGFCESYRHYGFEDRDLVACLLALGVEPRYERGAAVRHSAGYSVATYCRRLHEAAAYSAPIFRARHPRSYARLSYARIDPDMHPRIVAGVMRKLGSVTAEHATALVSRLVGSARVPWVLRAGAVQLAAALSFMAGAAQRR